MVVMFREADEWGRRKTELERKGREEKGGQRSGGSVRTDDWSPRRILEPDFKSTETVLARYTVHNTMEDDFQSLSKVSTAVCRNIKELTHPQGVFVLPFDPKCEFTPMNVPLALD
jgi:hypothetical protein